ncbi:MAG: IS701 family transposase [Betaproteobacteria bacterium]|nr:IS701 family transposase [Betaproteobacteria bacterium]
MASVEASLDGHFAPDARHFESLTRSVADSAERYLRGLYQSSRANMERMADVVEGSHYQRVHHMLSESSWDREGVRRQLVVDANGHFGRGGTALVIDESGFAKKGTHSAGVARQWNGRMGKTDNCQVGVFAAITRRQVAALVDAELYLPKAWTSDPKRCEAAGIPESAREFRTKGGIAFDMALRARRSGLLFDWVTFDAGYGHLPWLLQALEDEGERFFAELHSDQAIYLTDPQPAKGRAPTRLASELTPVTVAAWATAQAPTAWRRRKLRDGEKGEVERAFEDAKSACGMAHCQVRGWEAWHHHMTLVMIVLMFRVKQRIEGLDTHRLLSRQDIVEILKHKLPSKTHTDEELVMTIANRHHRRLQAAKSAYGKQGKMPPASFGKPI